MNNHFFAEENHLQDEILQAVTVYQAVIYIFWRVKGRLTGDIFFQQILGFPEDSGHFHGFVDENESPVDDLYYMGLSYIFGYPEIHCHS